jgi:hypothetical protein
MSVLVLILGLSAGASATETIAIAIAPQTVNLQFQGEWVTVHADIPFDAVVPGSVAFVLDDIDYVSADVEKADDCGDLVAKFDMDKKDGIGDYLKTFLEEGSATLTLSGDTTAGSSFSGSDTVRVIDQGGKRGK